MFSVVMQQRCSFLYEEISMFGIELRDFSAISTEPAVGLPRALWGRRRAKP